jgi:hypothetical protein
MFTSQIRADFPPIRFIGSSSLDSFALDAKEQEQLLKLGRDVADTVAGSVREIIEGPKAEPKAPKPPSKLPLYIAGALALGAAAWFYFKR